MKQLSNPIHDLITGLLSLLPMAVCLIAWEVLTEREMVCIGKHVFVYHARYVSMTVGIPHGSTMHVIPWFWMVWINFATWLPPMVWFVVIVLRRRFFRTRGFGL